MAQPGQADAPARRRRPLAAVAGSAPVLIAATLAGSVLAFLEKLPCRDGAWNNPARQFQLACYTDIYPLYYSEGLFQGKVPYSGHPVEYPVLIGAVMQAAAWLARPVSGTLDRGRAFYDITCVILVIFAVAGVLATAYLAGRRRRRDALLVALSPGLILAAFINWDLIAMALVALGMAAWAARRHVLAGVVLGLAVATKFYPLVFFGPLLLLCLRAGRMRAFLTTFGAAVVAWLVVNVPVIIAAPQGWQTFYLYSKHRPADWGSIWYFFEMEHVPLVGTTSIGALNVISTAAFAVACIGITVLALRAGRRPRLPQLCFLVLAAFLLTNKVWSPQYVIWLVPLAVLARPRFAAYAVWQLSEIAYFLGIWWYLLSFPNITNTIPGFQGIGTSWYFAALLARFAAVAMLCGLVVWDVLRPGRDVVRADGCDDPAGGVLDGAPDVFALRRGTVPARPAVLATGEGFTSAAG